MEFSIIIPAYNEGKNIGNVLGAVQQAQNLDQRFQEVLVVDDGSNDNTALVPDTLGIKVVRLTPNQGKGAAMVAGARVARSPGLLYIDADLVGLKPHHLVALIDPVDQGEARMTLGVFGGGRIRTDLAQVVAPEITGQRALLREEFLKLSGLEESRYGVDIALTHFAQKHDWTIKKVILKGVTQVMKEEKYGLLKGAKARFRMYWDIFKNMKV